MKYLYILILYVALVWHLGCQKNQAPIIEGLAAVPDSVGMGESATLFADAVDPDGDSIAYSWNCSRGSFSPTTGSIVTWTAPSNAGNYTIRAIVEDVAGAADTATTTVRVAGSEGPSLEKPDVNYEVRDEGGTLRLIWASVTGAEGYHIYADGERIYSTAANMYDATIPAAIYEVSSYAGEEESEKDAVDCVPVVTPDVVFWSYAAEPDYPSGLDFTHDGVPVARSVYDTQFADSIEYYFWDDAYWLFIRQRLGDHQSSNSGFTNFDLLEIAEPPSGNYADYTFIEEPYVYSLWLDPNGNGWDNGVDHFAKMRIDNLYGVVDTFTVYATFAYQLIPGLRWFVTD